MVVGACVRCMFCRQLAVGYCTVDGCYRLESCHILFWNWLSKIQLVLVLPSQTAPGLEPCVTPPDTWSFNVVLGTPYSVAAQLVDIVPSCAAFSAPALPHYFSIGAAVHFGCWYLFGNFGLIRSQALGLPHNLQKKTALFKMFELCKPLFISVKVFLVNNTLEQSKTAGILCWIPNQLQCMKP